MIISRWSAGRPIALDRRFQPLDVAVMVGPPNIDQPVKAAAKFIQMISEVGGKIGRRPVGADEDPVLVVTQLLRLEPERAVLDDSLAVLLQPADRFFDLALGMKVAFAENDEFSPNWNFLSRVSPASLFCSAMIDLTTTSLLSPFTVR